MAPTILAARQLPLQQTTVSTQLPLSPHYPKNPGIKLTKVIDGVKYKMTLLASTSCSTNWLHTDAGVKF